ncbi:MAG UNVERIFIED_CONTAM: nickel-dependent hydrogenase large subunit [Planctomycetaceae bacterium]|jgi:coenzyme F420-reducing hydrogenase alpha subunit
MSTIRTIRVETLTRVEGEGALNIRVDGGIVLDAQLAIYEPPRFFEAFLRGPPLEEVPDLTARICGICPVAYQLTSVQALERALGITITPELRRLRRLMYCASGSKAMLCTFICFRHPTFLTRPAASNWLNAFLWKSTEA